MTIMVSYRNHMGSDLTPVNAARVSMGKQKEQFDETDEKLLGYLARENHWTPYSHAVVQFHVKCPIFVERQIFKHQVGFSYNSVSGRYVEFKDGDYHKFPTFRKGSSSIKQGSLSEGVSDGESAQEEYEQAMLSAFDTYHRLLNLGVCREQARAVLPLSLHTEFIVTGSLYAWARMYGLRSKSDAQREIQEYAKQVDKLIEPLYPVAWCKLTRSVNDE